MTSRTRNGCFGVSLCTLTEEAFWANQACSETSNIAEEGNNNRRKINEYFANLSIEFGYC